MPVSPAHAQRTAQLERLKAESFDVLVIGGGITGAGIARDSALRGFKTALVEKQDFAGGTSGNSARLAHGGLRYVETLEFGVVYQACAERRILQNIAPHQVMPIPFIIPLSEKPGRRFKVRLGMGIYDALALYGNVQVNKHLSRQQVSQAEPGVSLQSGQDAMRYWERAVDDARMTLTTILAAVEQGAVALNYVEVVELLKIQDRVVGVGLRDQLSGATLEVKATRVVNASGPWNDAIRRLDESGLAPSVRPNKGIHVIVPQARLPIKGAMDFPAAGGKRTMYAVHWRQTTIIGTTDTDYDGDLDNAHAQKDEVAWILESVNGAFANTHLTEADIVSTYAGLRPLVRSDGSSAYKATREHHILVSPSGLISISGGKFTTHRAMARDVMDLISTQLQAGKTCRTHQVPLDGGLATQQAVLALLENVHSVASELDEDVVQHLVASYGSQALTLLNLAAQDAKLKRRIVEGLPYLYAEIPYAINHEMACTLSDMLIRRTRLMHETPQQGLAQAETIAVLMGELLGWNDAERSRQVQDYRERVALTRRFADSSSSSGVQQ